MHRIEIEGERGGTRDSWRAMQKGMQFQVGEVRRPDERGQIVHQAIVDFSFLSLRRTSVVFTQSGRWEGHCFS